MRNGMWKIVENYVEMLKTFVKLWKTMWKTIRFG